MGRIGGKIGPKYSTTALIGNWLQKRKREGSGEKEGEDEEG